MEEYSEERESALKKIRVADHMLNMTFPIVQDPKILMAVLENIFLSMEHSISSILHYERKYKRIPPFQGTFESKFNMFRMRCVDRYNIPKEYLIFISEIREIILKHKESPMEFRRKDKFVICSDDYDLKTISIKEIKDFLIKSRLFCENIFKIIEKNERLMQ